MHELTLTEGLVSAVHQRVGSGAKVTRVRLEIGVLAAVVPDAMRFCFEICAKGTPLENAALQILEIPGHGRCRDCGGRVELQSLLDLCACGSARVQIETGQELRIKDVEVI